MSLHCYMIIGKNSKGDLEWYVCETKEQAASFIKIHYKDILEKCKYDWMLVHKEIFVIEVPAGWKFKALNLIPPSEPVVEVH